MSETPPTPGREGLVLERGEPRVLLFSQRSMSHYMWETPQAEFEDVILEVDGAELIAPVMRSEERRRARSGESMLTRWADAGRALGDQLRSGVRQTLRRPKHWPIAPIDLAQDYELFFAVFHFPRNIAVTERLHQVRRRSRIMSCFLIECWPGQIAANRQHLRLLDEFDHVFLFNAASAEDIQRETTAQCHFLPTGVDALRFAPYPLNPERHIDVYGMGRGSPGMHAQLCEMAESEELHYEHALVNHEVPDYRSHRVQVANILKRSRFFPAYKINENRRALTHGQEALATRYFEGAAAGTIMLGSTPDAPEFSSLFPYDDAVIPVPYRSPSMRAILRALDAQPERLARNRCNAVAHALATHDWLYRWRTVLRVVGLGETAGMAGREARLNTLGEAVRAGQWLDVEREAASAPAARRARSRPADPGRAVLDLHG